MSGLYALTRAQARAWDLRLTDKITVCDSCLCACCWAGIFYCDEYISAGTKKITVAEARRLAREHSDYWIELRKAEGHLPMDPRDAELAS